MIRLYIYMIIIAGDSLPIGTCMAINEQTIEYYSISEGGLVDVQIASVEKNLHYELYILENKTTIILVGKEIRINENGNQYSYLIKRTWLSG